MRTLSLCLAIFAGGANAQTGRGEAIVKQLTERLLPLKDLSPDRGPKQTEIAEGFAAQMFQHYRIGIISKDLASSLTSALAGKDLTPENLTRLMQSMISSINAAFLCRDTKCELGNSTRFRVFALDVYNALLDLDVSVRETSNVTEGLFKAGLFIVKRPPLYWMPGTPIPPAYPPKLSRQQAS